MRRMTYFVMALALVLGLSQCKKEQPVEPENEAKTVNISLKVGGHGGSRHTINTENGDVDFQDGDVIYVGNGSTYIGTLINSGGVFTGDINEPADGTEIYFFFVGGLPTTPADLSGKSSFTVDISNQSTQMPVLSCNHVTYYSSTTSYSCTLQNQCALVQFTTASTTDPVHVGGLYTEAKIDFANNSITNNGTKGFVALNSKSATEKWAVLLPQTGFGAEAAVAHVGYTTTIPTIAADGFITGDAAISISTLSNIVYLDWLTSDYTATDGQTLNGTLNGNYQVSIADGATVTLSNATITGENDDDYSWAGLTCLGNATIVLADGTTNNVTSFFEDYPGIHIASGKTLTIQGSGTLNASSNGGVDGWGAGIGGSDLVDCGNIVINSGTIYATGGVWMAGIGGGYNKNCGSITINGGNVTSTGGDKAAGIGTGCVTANNTITGINISGGTVVATGGIGGAGIGTGLSRGNITGGGISITGGEVTATGGIGAAGIGSGFVLNTYTTSSTCGNISITGGEVTATGGDGGENTSNSFGIGSIYSEPFFGGAGIGTGSTVNSNYSGASNCGTITIGSGVTRVTATKGGGNYPATNSIGKTVSTHNRNTCGTITIGGTVYYQNNAYVGDGATYLTQSPLVYPTPTPVEQIVDLSTITSAYTAVDGDILTGSLGTGVQISIADDATITLRSANINGSDNLSGTFHGLNCLGDATIILENNNNVVKAKCGEDDGRAGIFVPQSNTLTIQAGNNSGKIEATGAGEAAGIGGYSGAHCGAIVINSGKVTAEAGSGVDSFYGGGSAGIGSSSGKRCDGITIHSGQIIAKGGYGAAGIGTGYIGICKKDGDSSGTEPAITINISSYAEGWVKAEKGSDATYFIGGGTSSKCGIVIVGGNTYEDGGGNRGISSSTSLSSDFTVSGNSLIYMPE